MLVRSIAVSILLLLSTAVFGKPVVLACEGEFVECTKLLNGGASCSPPKTQKNLIEYEGSSTKQLDDYGFLAYKGSCKATDLKVTCFEPVQWEGVSSAFKGFRSMELERTTGRVDGAYDVDFGPENKLIARAKGLLLTWKGYCTVRENRQLF